MSSQLPVTNNLCRYGENPAAAVVKKLRIALAVNAVRFMYSSHVSDHAPPFYQICSAAISMLIALPTPSERSKKYTNTRRTAIKNTNNGYNINMTALRGQEKEAVRIPPNGDYRKAIYVDAVKNQACEWKNGVKNCKNIYPERKMPLRMFPDWNFRRCFRCSSVWRFM